MYSIVCQNNSKSFKKTDVIKQTNKNSDIDSFEVDLEIKKALNQVQSSDIIITASRIFLLFIVYSLSYLHLIIIAINQDSDGNKFRVFAIFILTVILNLILTILYGERPSIVKRIAELFIMILLPLIVLGLIDKNINIMDSMKKMGQILSNGPQEGILKYYPIISMILSVLVLPELISYIYKICPEKNEDILLEEIKKYEAYELD